MGLNEKRVAIELQTTIEDNGQMERNTIKQTGLFYNKNKFKVITFEEITEENSIIKNLITIQPNKVNIKRSGAVSMNQQFLAGQTTESYFQHAHGKIHMLTNTKSITYEPEDSSNQGQLIISYTVKLNDQTERVHHLTLTFTEEDF